MTRMPGTGGRSNQGASSRRPEPRSRAFGGAEVQYPSSMDWAQTCPVAALNNTNKASERHVVTECVNGSKWVGLSPGERRPLSPSLPAKAPHKFSSPFVLAGCTIPRRYPLRPQSCQKQIAAPSALTIRSLGVSRITFANRMDLQTAQGGLRFWPPQFVFLLQLIFEMRRGGCGLRQRQQNWISCRLSREACVCTYLGIAREYPIGARFLSRGSSHWSGGKGPK